MKLSYNTCLKVAFAFFLGACFQLTNGKRELNEKRSIFANSKAVYIFHLLAEEKSHFLTRFKKRRHSFLSSACIGKCNTNVLYDLLVKLTM